MSDDERRTPAPGDEPRPWPAPPDGPDAHGVVDDLDAQGPSRSGATSSGSLGDAPPEADRSDAERVEEDVRASEPGAPRAGSQDTRNAHAGVAPEGPGPVPVTPPAAPPPPSASPRDPNLEAVSRAGLAPDLDGWLREVASQVDPRLERVAPGWRRSEQSGAARACVFGLMLGRLSNDYPYTSDDLSRVAEVHPSFGTLPAGNRLATLREIAADKQRGAAWIAPLVGVDDPSRLYDILD